MTAPADDSAVEEAFEAYLAGRAVPAAGDRLASFADALRVSANEPGRPSAALADLLANGLLTDQPGPSASTARRSRRRRSRMLAPALFTKLATAGVAAKAATITGAAVVGLTTVGFTGNLGPAQHGFATLVDHATPFTVPDPATPTGTGNETVSTPAETSPTATVTEPSATPTTAAPSGSGDEAGENSPKPGGTAHPSNYGGQVSEWAHEKNRERKAGATTVPAKPTKDFSRENVLPGQSRGPNR